MVALKRISYVNLLFALIVLMIFVFSPVSGEEIKFKEGNEFDVSYGFNVEPKINLEVTKSNISEDNPGKIGISINNQGGNDNSVVTKFKFSVPEKTELQGPGLSIKDTNYIAEYKTSPKEKTTLNLSVMSENQGTIAINANIEYWPSGEMENSKQRSKTMIFDVIEISDSTERNGSDQTDSNQTDDPLVNGDNSSGISFGNDPMFILLLLAVTGLVMSSIVFAYKSGRNGQIKGGKFLSGSLLGWGISRYSLQIPKTFFTDFMETRAESQFRPGEKDVEIVYALTGTERDKIDMRHKFTSEQVVTESSSKRVNYQTSNVIDHISKKRDDPPEVLVKLHTHPRGTTKPSEKDLNSWNRVKTKLKNKWPDTKVLFGIHAFSREFKNPKKRKDPQLSGKTQVEWRSLTREHKVKIYDHKGNPIRLII